MKRFLFICSQNKLRGPTAEQIFSELADIEVRSAGLNNDAINGLTSEDIIWAEYIFVMEKVHKIKLQQKFKKHLNKQRVIVLDIPDKYKYMEQSLIEQLKIKVGKYL